MFSQWLLNLPIISDSNKYHHSLKV